MTPPPAPAPDPAAGRVRAALLLLLAAVAVALIALGASADRGEIGSVDGGPVRTAEATLDSGEVAEPDWATQEPPPPPPDLDPGAGAALLRGLVIGLGVLAAVVLALLVVRLVRLAPPPLPEAAAAGDDEDLTDAQARAALEDARERLSTTVSAQDGVVAAWRALEAHLAAAGLRRDPAQTTREFVVTVLAARELDRPALDALADLYRRALFDDRPLTEDDRRAAAAHLDLLTGRDRTAVSGTAVPGTSDPDGGTAP